MLSDLKIVEDNLFTQATIQQFYGKHNIYEVV